MNKYIETANFDVEKFPLDCGTLRGMQDNTAILAVLARIAAGQGTDRLILCGCEDMGNGYRGEGYIWKASEERPLTGEIIYHKEQRLCEKFLIKETAESVNVDGVDYYNLYKHREANDSSIGTEKWSEYTRIDEVSNVALKALMDAETKARAAADEAEAKARAEADERLSNLIKQMSIVPKNMIMLWDLENGPIPEGWVPYEKMYGRFALGASYNNGKWDCGEEGGEESHTLTEDEMPAHKHETTTQYAGEHEHDISHRGWRALNPSSDENIKVMSFENISIDSSTSAFGCTKAGKHTHNVTVKDAGAGQAHNNMPPYVKLIYVIKI